MREIERAIEYIESMSPIDEQEGEALSAALKALRAELEREKNPLTWNERINQMTVEEKARYLCNYVGQCVNERGTPPFKPCDKMYVLDTPKDGQYRDCLKCWEGYLNSAAEVGK